MEGTHFKIMSFLVKMSTLHYFLYKSSRQNKTRLSAGFVLKTFSVLFRSSFIAGLSLRVMKFTFSKGLFFRISSASLYKIQAKIDSTN